MDHVVRSGQTLGMKKVDGIQLVPMQSESELQRAHAENHCSGDAGRLYELTDDNINAYSKKCYERSVRRCAGKQLVGKMEEVTTDLL